jgi:hypothetical protein
MFTTAASGSQDAKKRPKPTENDMKTTKNRPAKAPSFSRRRHALLTHHDIRLGDDPRSGAIQDCAAGVIAINL